MNNVIEVKNGVKIPQLGFGVYKIKKGEQFERAIREAIRVGYRHFDTAKIYGNEEALGLEIQKSGIPGSNFSLPQKCGRRISVIRRRKRLLNIPAKT